ncbi:helix-turn-helix domain-containing protein [Flavobacterium sp.]|uniref:helix-turn-helix domain-containing protein n=1 Tax=Flavobacterium sp. TaxID=239 RepID=UPI00248889A9|nr:helix-turn-helix domain-containing protein [Flavobacterium sp.]MDI1315854.1 helix-turn-helix domain-containing protein [Flavobacterium sp.]
MLTPYITYIFTIGCFFTLVFATRLLYTKLGNTFLNKLLAIVILARGSQLVYILLVNSGKLATVPFVLKVFNPLYFAAPACFYLYFKGFVKDESRLRKWEWLHFLPLLFAIADMLAWYFMDSHSQQMAIAEITTRKSLFISNSTGIVPFHINLLLRTLLFIGYLFFSWRIVFQNFIFQKTIQNKTARTWLLLLIKVVTIGQLIATFPFVAKFILGYYQFDELLYQLYMSFFSVLILTMSILAIYNPKILYGYIFLSKDIAVKNIAIDDTKQTGTDTNSSAPKGDTKLNTVVSEQLTEQYIQTIIAFMISQKPYLNPEFSLMDLAQEMNLPMHHCSYLVNYEIGENFRDWINGYRIGHFIQEYPINSNVKTIHALSMESGFKNKSTFYNSFKKVKGVSPVDYFRV